MIHRGISSDRRIYEIGMNEIVESGRMMMPRE
jgi:hypothetical protein